MTATTETPATATEPTTEEELRRRLATELDGLPAEALAEVASFLEYQRFKLEKDETAPADLEEHTGLGGLWAGYGLKTEDLDEARREMWANFGEREF